MSDSTSFPGTPEDSPTGHGMPTTSGHAPSTSLRDLLTRVAAGEIDPAEAASLLDDDASAPGVGRGDVRPS